MLCKYCTTVLNRILFIVYHIYHALLLLFVIVYDHFALSTFLSHVATVSLYSLFTKY